MSSVARLRSMEPPEKVRSSQGESSTAAAGRGKPSSRARTSVASTALPPAASPTSARLSAELSSDTARYAARQSSIDAGYGGSGARGRSDGGRGGEEGGR